MLDGRTGTLRWAVDQPPIGIYSYAPALVNEDTAALRNCLNYLAPNSLCVYTRRVVPARRAQAPPTAPVEDNPFVEGAAAAAGVGTSGAAAPRVALPALAALLCAAALILF